MTFRLPKFLLPLPIIVAAFSLTATAQTFSTLFTFDGANGYTPQGPLVQALDGNFYGTTSEGGTNSARGGTLFRITSSGQLTNLWYFCSPPPLQSGANPGLCPGGAYPSSGLTLAFDGSLWGTTSRGGANDAGMIYKYNPARIVYSFCSQSDCADGSQPLWNLVQTRSGDFYGTTIGNSSVLFSTIFKVTPAGALTTIYSSCSLACEVGTIGPLIQATNGNLYGASFFGGASGKGAIFEVTPTGTLTILYSFCTLTNCADGSYPVSGLLQATDGAFYGATTAGGTNDEGTVFRFTTSGKMTTLHSFCKGGPPTCTDGARPNAPLIQASDGNLYGTASLGGAYGNGDIFRVSAGGQFTILYSLNPLNGEQFPAAIVQGTDGNLYGATEYGFGTIFRFSLGLNPFVEALPAFGRAGDTIKILGQGLSETATVAVNGVPASFQIASDTYITATIPAGATSGYITVATNGGGLSSDFPFQVLP